MQVDSRTCSLCKTTKAAAAFSDKSSWCKECAARRERERKALKRAGRVSRPRLCFECSADISNRAPQAVLCKRCVAMRRGGQRRPRPAHDFAAAVALVRQGITVEDACVQARIPYTTLARALKRDSQLASAMEQAVKQAAELRLPEHGTAGRYSRGCRCTDCRTGKAQRSAEWRSKVRSEEPVAFRHGLGGRLNHQCPCDVCRRAAREQGNRWQRSTNGRLLESARRHNAQWTGPELELALRSDLSARQVAEMIGRTLWAVSTMRRRLRKEPMLDHIAGASRDA